MKKGFLTFMLVIAALVSACGDKKDGSPAGTPGQPPIGVNQCPAGTFPSQYGCLPQGNCPAGQVLYNNQCIVPNPGTTNGQRWGAYLTISNRDVFARFLEFTSFGQCMKSNSFGTYDCDNYTSRGYVIINGSSANINTGAQFTLVVGGYYNSGYSYPIEVNVPTTYQPINNNTGFVLQDQAQFGYPYGRVRAIVDTGAITATSFTVRLTYDGTEFANSVVSAY